MISNILSIAGSDPSGGAGVQADIKTISANGGYAMAVVTALTAQNTRGVNGIEIPPASFVSQQIDAIFEDVRVDAVKIGMVATAEIAAAIAKALVKWRPRAVVVDPVMVAKGGASLLSSDAVEVIRRDLVPLADILTPNLPEAAALLAEPPAKDRCDMPAVAARLCAAGARSVMLKGGHLTGPESPDYLTTNQGDVWLEGRRTPTRNTHGTGCTLSSALAIHLAITGDVKIAAQRAKAYVTDAIAAADALDVGEGHGPLNHFVHHWNRS